MFFPGTDRFVIQTYKRVIQKTYILAKKGRMLFPAERYQEQSDLEGIFQFISFHKFNKGSLTLEMAIVLPLFLFAMLAMLQFATVENASSALLAGAQDTAKEMAAYAYIQNMGAAEKAGIQKGDILTEFDGKEVTSMENMQEILKYYKAGKKVKVKVQVADNGTYKEKELTVKLGKRPSE